MRILKINIQYNKSPHFKNILNIKFPFLIEFYYNLNIYIVNL